MRTPPRHPQNPQIELGALGGVGGGINGAARPAWLLGAWWRKGLGGCNLPGGGGKKTLEVVKTSLGGE